MLVLGEECTAHTLGFGLFDGKIRANARSTYKSKTGGIVPAEAAQHHKRVAPAILEQALEQASATMKDVNLVAVSTGPGLPPCLAEGLRFARTLNKPLVSVNHCVSHIEIGRYSGHCKDPLVVYVSGGNTQIIAHDTGRYRVYGETLDIGLGNAIDKFSRELGLPSPGGAVIEKLAAQGKCNTLLPYTVKGMDLTYAGLVTAAAKLAGKIPREDLCCSFQETAFAMLCETAERALAHTRKHSVLLTGGVAQNKRLQEMLRTMAAPHKAALHVPPAEYCGDNGLQSAILGWLMYTQRGPKVFNSSIDIKPRWRTDDAEIFWVHPNSRRHLLD